jgi:DNA-binding transcriptional LysR family regulator
MIELRHFRQFVAVAEESSFRRAAARLHMAQPPLTAAIRKIEADIGTRLIARRNRIEGLTPAGEAFLLEARRALAQADRAVEMARRAGEGVIGSLRVSFVASTARDLLPRALRAFRAQHGKVELELREATTAEQVNLLMQDRADVGLVASPLPALDGLNVRSLYRSGLVVALPAAHRATARARLALSNLADEPWILFPARQGPGLHRQILSACAVAGFVPRVVQEAVQMETIIGLVAAGLGVSLVPPTLAEIGRVDVAFRTLRGPGSPVAYELAIAYLKFSPLVDAFARCLHSAVVATDGKNRGTRRAAAK